MPRPKSAQPAYGFHVSGQAVVRLDYKDYYLGKHGSPESYAKYYSLLAEYNANGKKAPDQPQHLAEVGTRVRDLVEDFRHQMLPLYEHNYGQHNRYKNLLIILEERHGNESVEDFGPRKLSEIRSQFIKDGCSRIYANGKAALLIKIFQHGVARELVSPERLVALQSLPPLRKGQGRETVKRPKVSVEVIKNTLPKLSPMLQAMVKIQLGSAMRPSELFRMTPGQIDRTGPVWIYRPKTHKTEHHGKSKAIPILGQALEALQPYLFRGHDVLCFATAHGNPWDKDNYRQAVVKAAQEAGQPHWTPYDLRHCSAQAVRDALGAEAAQAILGHSRLDVTERYAQVALERAIEAAKVTPKLA